jgi:glutamyl-tRNA synthetase
MGFPIFPLNWTDPVFNEVAIGYREAGYLPQALLNFLAFLGWNPGTEQELFSMDELIKEFSVERIGKAGTKFDIQKAQWYNQQYLRAKPDEELARYLLEDLSLAEIECSKEKAIKIVKILKERVSFPRDFYTQSEIIFADPETFEEAIVSKKWNEDVVKVLTAYKDALADASDFNADHAKTLLEKVCADLGIGMGKIMQAFRLAITGLGAGPDLMAIMDIIGKEAVIRRIDYALKTLPHKSS